MRGHQRRGIAREDFQPPAVTVADEGHGPRHFLNAVPAERLLVEAHRRLVPSHAHAPRPTCSKRLTIFTLLHRVRASSRPDRRSGDRAILQVARQLRECSRDHRSRRSGEYRTRPRRPCWGNSRRLRDRRRPLTTAQETIAASASFARPALSRNWPQSAMYWNCSWNRRGDRRGPVLGRIEPPIGRDPVQPGIAAHRQRIGVRRRGPRQRAPFRAPHFLPRHAQRTLPEASSLLKCSRTLHVSGTKV